MPDTRAKKRLHRDMGIERAGGIVENTRKEIETCVKKKGNHNKKEWGR